MAKISLHLYTQKSYTDDSLRALTLAFSSNQTTYCSPIGIQLTKKQWNAKKCIVIRHPEAKALTLEAHRILVDAQSALLEYSREHNVDSLNGKQLRDIILGIVYKRQVSSQLIIPYMRKFADLKQRKNTKSVYMSTISRLLQYKPDMENIVFDTINPTWLREFDKWLFENGCPSVNARSIHFRNIRAIFNAAIDDGITTNYPFRKFKIKSERTSGRCLTVEEMRKLRSLELEGVQQYSRDVFMLSFYMMGINMADMYSLEIHGDMVSYRRKKTGKLYEFKLQPEAKELLEVLDWVQSFASPHVLVSKVNQYLKPVGSMIGVPNLTTYWGRHSWATIAASLDIPKETIAEALGHSSYTVTDIYIIFDHSKVDKANRAVIDYLVKGESVQ